MMATKLVFAGFKATMPPAEKRIDPEAQLVVYRGCSTA